MEFLKSPHEGASLLIIENDLSFANRVEQLLEPLGIEIETGTDYAFDEIKSRAPDLILLSAQMNATKFDGFSVCQRIRSEEALKSTQIIITVEKSQRDSIQDPDSVNERADRYLIKPISNDDLRREIISLLSNDYFSSAEEESVAFVEDEEVLEIAPDPESKPPPLPNTRLEPWQATSFDEMVNTRSNIDNPAPPRQPNEESRLAYLRERVRFLEEKERAMKDAWSVIQEQGKEMEQQAANGQIAARHQYEELKTTQAKLKAEKQKFKDFSQKVTKIFADKDEEETRLHQKIRGLSLEQKRRQHILEELEQQYEELEAKLQTEKERSLEREKQKQTGDEERRKLKEEHEKAMSETQQMHETVLEGLSSEHDSQLAVIASEHASEILEIEARYSGIITDLTQQRKADIVKIEAEAQERLEATVQQLNESHSCEKFLLRQELKNRQRGQKEQRGVLEALLETERSKVVLAGLKHESDASAYDQLQYKQTQTENERNILRAERNELRALIKSLEQKHLHGTSLLHEKGEKEKQLREHIATIEQELAERYLEIETLHSEFSVLEVQAETKDEQLTALQVEEKKASKQLEAKLESLREAQEAQRKELEQTKKEKEQAETKKLEHRIKWQEAEQNSARLTSRVHVLETQRDRLMEKTESQAKELTETKKAEGEVLQLRKDLDKATQRIEQLHSENQEKEKLISVARIELAQAETAKEQAETLLVEQKNELRLIQDQLEEGEAKLKQLREEFARSEENQESEKQRKIYSLQRELQTQTEDQKNTQEKNQRLADRLALADSEFKKLEDRVNRETVSLEEELSDAQSSLFVKLETIRNLEKQLEDAEVDYQEVEAERNILLARLDGAIRRIDDLEAQMITREQLSDLRRISESTEDSMDTASRDTVPPSVSEIDADGGKGETVDVSSLLPYRDEDPVEKTTAELVLPQAYLEAASKVEFNREKTGEDNIISLDMDDSVILSIASSDVDSLDDDTNTIRGNSEEIIGTEDLESLENGLDEKTNPSLAEMNSDTLTPVNYDEIEEKLAALQALEFSAGEIRSRPSDDPFINPRHNQGE
ncbi:MAG: response regulator [Myxococcota bacterium]|nr:response regulator [Myxococcota bacterium]